MQVTDLCFTRGELVDLLQHGLLKTDLLSVKFPVKVPPFGQVMVPLPLYFPSLNSPCNEHYTLYTVGMYVCRCVCVCMCVLHEGGHQGWWGKLGPY